MEQRLLTLMRHATAELASDRDHTRRLSSEGLDEARRVGARIAERGETPDRIFASTALRCLQTRDALCAGLGHEVETEFEDALYNASESHLRDTLAAQSSSGSLLLLAHNPGISMLALGLCPNRSAELEEGGTQRSDDEAERTRRVLRSQWLQMQGGFAPASIARFEVHEIWSELAPHSTHFLGFEEPPRG